MKIYNDLWNLIPGPKTGRAAGSTEAAPDAFRTLLKQKCQESGAPGNPAPADATLDLAGSALDLLERIATQIGSGASAREMAASHEQLAASAARLRGAADSLPPGPLKSVLAETAALSYLQLWKFEQGEFV